MIRVLLVDDHTLVRAGLQRLLDQTSDIEVVAVAERGEEAVKLAEELTPDVILMDVSMPGQSGIESTRKICQKQQNAAVIMLTAATDRDRIIDAFDAGALGYLIKDSDPTVLIEGVRAAANGDAPLDPRAARAVLDNRRKDSGPSLSSRETEVLLLVSDGMPNKLIARRLGISESTVKAHLTSVFSQLGVTDRTQAALWAKDHLSVS
ncbi:MAG: response regulator transcription factor [Acidimicrobiia bacterium]|nr:response regulator transcription factor [Acidimicrobiia bacterium]